MFKKTALALVLALAATPALAIDFGAGFGAHQSGAVSQAGSASQGGSVAAIAGVTGQGSQASANNTSFAAGGFSNNNAWNVTGSQGSTSQSGGAFALGGALSGNGNQAVQQGTGASQSALLAGWVFVSP